MDIAMIGQKSVVFSEKSGGVEKHVEELSTRLVKLGNNVTVYSRPRHTLRGKKTKKYKGVKVVYLPSIPTKNLDTITHVFLATIHVLFKKADIIHYHGVGPSTLAWIPRIFKRKTKVVVTFHSIDRFHKKWGWFARIYLGWGEWTACNFPHETIVVSKAIQEYCRERFNKETIYLPNGVNIEKEEKTDDDKIKKYGLKRNEYILTVARLIKHKGIHHLINAYKNLEAKYSENEKKWPGGKKIKLAIVGAPSYTDDYLNYLHKLADSSPDIVFVGFQKGKTLAQLFTNAYLYVHPSEAEGLAITILEAMSYGKCVLVSNIPENLEAINSSGYSFESKNIKDLEKILIQLLHSKNKVMECARDSINLVKKNYDWKDITKKTVNIYENLGSRK
ncbi:MAG: glycosyltransferase [Candidatus Magasanikbacteria bacterium]|nr:glycosyltransferase [Candidatus Magasanikbacteria bacterium]